MRVFTFLLILSLFCTSAFSQAKADFECKDAKIQVYSDIVDSLFTYSAYNGQQRYFFSYDSNYKISSFLRVGSQSSFSGDSVKTTYTYEMEGKPPSRLIEVWKNGDWVNSEKNTYTYDTNGNQITFFHENWKEFQWVVDYRSSSTFDDNGNRLMDITEQRSYDLWYVKRNTYIYDQKGNLLNCLTEKLFNGLWENSDKSTFTYDNKGNQITFLKEQWEEDKWISYYRVYNIYNLNKKILYYYSESLRNGELEKDKQCTYNYDINGKLLSYLTKQWDYYDYGKWMGFDSCTYTYNSNENILNVFYKMWNGYWGPNTDINLYFVDSRGNVFSQKGWYLNVSYRLATPVKEEIINTSLILNCSPNPASELIIIDYTLPEPQNVSFTITNSLGIEIARIDNSQSQTAGEHSFGYDVGNLATGVYFLTMRSGKNTETKKFVVVR